MTFTATAASPTARMPVTAEPRPSAQAEPLDAHRLIDDLFLTPRVVDRRGFEELAGLLKSLVQDAAAKGESLRGTAAEVRMLGDSLREATKQLQVRLEAALKVAPALDQRVAKAEQVVQLAVDRTALTEQLEQSISRIIETRLADYGRRLEELNARNLENLEAAASRIAGDLDARRDRLIAQAADTATQAEAARGRLSAELESFQHVVRTQIDAAAERLADPVRQADRRASEIASTVAREVEAAEQKLRDARDQADVKLAGLVETISRHAEAVSRRAQDQCGAVEVQVREVLDKAALGVDELRQQAQELSTRVGSVADAATHVNTAHAEERIEAASAAAAEQVAQAGARIAAQLVDVGRATLDAAQESQRSISTHATRAVESMQEAAHALGDRLDAARRLLEELPSMIDRQVARLDARGERTRTGTAANANPDSLDAAV